MCDRFFRRRLEATAAMIFYDGVLSSHYQAGSWRKPGEPLAEDEARCLTVAVKGPWLTEWSCIAPYARAETGEVVFLEEQEFEQCVAPWLPDWWLRESTDAPN